MSIQQKIEEITERRTSLFLPKIEQRLQYLDKLGKEIEKLESLLALIHSQNDAKSGTYYTILANDPAMEMRLQQVSTAHVSQLLEQTRKELQRLQVRFSRDGINISVIGRARQGKSRLLQSISGLPNEVIPASNGGDCTGAKSVIVNSKGNTHAEIVFYTEIEMVEQIQRYLDECGISVRLGSIGQVQSLKNTLDTFGETLGKKSARVQSLYGHLCKYVDHYEEYACHIGTVVEEVNENKIRSYVAQYDNDMVATYTYLAVKEVKIFTEFPLQESGKIVLVDTIGLGDTSLGIRDKMLETLRNDSDAAILVRLPAATGDGVRVEDDELYDLIREAMGSDILDKWLFMALNVCEELGNNNSGDAMVTALKNKQWNVASITKVNCGDQKDVEDKLLLPLLDNLLQNLGDIDASLMSNANILGLQLYAAFQNLAQHVAKVIAGSMKHGSNEMKKFRELFQRDLDYSNELKKLDNRYAEQKDKECPEVRESIERVIATLPKLICKPDEITVDVERGKDATNSIFEKYVKVFRNRIYDAFAKVNTDVLVPLQDEVKNSIIQILFTNAKFGRIPLQHYAVEDGASQEWLSSFINEKVDKDVYPKIYQMLHFVLDYRLNIQGLIEYNVAKCLNTIDKHNEEFRTMNPITGVSDAQHAKKIWSEIVSRATTIQSKMRSWRDEFSLIPSHSFYARISMYRDMMVDDNAAEEELYNFYTENRMTIWRDEFAAMIEEEAAFGNWNEISRNLTNLCIKKEFTTNIQ